MRLTLKPNADYGGVSGKISNNYREHNVGEDFGRIKLSNVMVG